MHNVGKRKREYLGVWKNDVMNNSGVMTSRWFYEGAESKANKGIVVYLNGIKNDLGVDFDNLSPKRLPYSKSYFLNKTNPLFGRSFF